jgi:hypothetical protein
MLRTSFHYENGTRSHQPARTGAEAMTTDKFLEGALLVVIGALCAVVFLRIKWGRERRKVNVPVKVERRGR